jgi:hypothetical protein
MAVGGGALVASVGAALVINSFRSPFQCHSCWQ